jgi:tetratricopeptide (TPR) repeat protein
MPRCSSRIGLVGLPLPDMTPRSSVLACLVVLALPATLRAESRILETRITGEHRMGRGDTPESARRLALADARSKAVTWAIGHLERRTDVRALRLTPFQLHAYAAVIVDIPALPDRTEHASTKATLQVRARLEVANAARQMAGFRQDEWVSYELVAAWSEIQRLHQQLTEETRRRASTAASDAGTPVHDQLQTLTALDVKHVTARAYAAMARTEPATTGGRTIPASGLDRARQLAGTALALAPESPDARYLMGDLLVEVEQPQTAEVEYRKALDAGTRSSVGRTKLAAALRYQGKLAEAIAELREAQSIDPTFARAHSDLGTILSAQRSFPEAIAAYREAIRLDPGSTEARNGLGVALARTGQLEEAVASFREIVRIDPDSTIGYYNLSYALADLDRDSESAAALREVIRIYPDHYNARYNLGELFRLEGKFDDSATQFREYLRLAPDTPQNRRNITRAQQFVRQFEDLNAPVADDTMRRRQDQ